MATPGSPTAGSAGPSPSRSAPPWTGSAPGSTTWRRPAVLIPYPLAHGHQGANARLVEAVGGGLRLEEREATPERLLWIVRQFLHAPALRQRMSRHVRSLARPDATARLAQTITALGISRRRPASGPVSSDMVSGLQAHPAISG